MDIEISFFMFYFCPPLWQYELESFQTRDTKLERFLPKNQHSQRKWLNFNFWINDELSKSAKIWLWNSIFYVKSHPNFSQFFFSFENTNLGAHFLIISITLLLKMMPYFWQPAISPKLKFQWFIVCWFLRKFFSNFAPPAWKLHNLYCHCPMFEKHVKQSKSPYYMVDFTHCTL